MTPEQREFVGKLVRRVWVGWAKEQPNPKPSWLVPYEELPEPDKEVDRRIGETVAMFAVGAWHADGDTVVEIDYTNHRGVRAMRRIRPLEFHFGTSPYHPEPQFLIEAIDLDKGGHRTFAAKDVHDWKVIIPR
jgi:hypothetical protein